ncbi:MAG: metal-dependent hydrolase [Caulobacteraceae bacterium]|nr:metal-dependent hydrolase [Caulobacteraceae bacterium]
MTSYSQTPDDLTIHPRDLAFSRETHHGRWWLGGDPVGTAFYNALSATFPHGERFFMDSVKRYRDIGSPTLQAQITAFVTQEAMHTREHLFFNKQAADHGYDMAAMEARTKTRLDYARTRRGIDQLGATVALEHFTAILAHALLADPRHMEGAPAEAKAMWRWHAIEEIEHKAVAYDTFITATRSMSGLRRWLLRSSVMVLATGLLMSTVGSNIADSFKTDGINRPASWLRLMKFMLVRPGMLRQVFGSYLAYFRPGFHPWSHDDRGLVTKAEQELSRHYEVGVVA